MKQIALIRHGITKGNLSKCYIGKTEEPLCEEGMNELLLKKESGSYPFAESIYCSPMLRCQMTANLLYPNRELKLVPDFRECDFGLFEGKNYRQLSKDPLYQQWIDSNGMAPFPLGESREEFEYRCREAYKKVIKELYQETSFSDKERDRETVKGTNKEANKEISKETDNKSDAVLIVHGGTIMAILSAFATEKKDYYAWGCGNGNGYLLSAMEDGRLEVIRKI
ncbi:MAG TPA: histidine phosphatase family protein [Lachnoclostridium phytofermentans]|uniref:Histidine phosphatase family protein n=1 Tax=Lachnoclostridium phytofermentans TaxID=66219 RepID=A0A3D2X8W8_9FIRM|nr:histidine phosphatase family protein [Lachnoclostridium sp.]HCL03167.1 histidine phosphatase family protein [Lachnoclostridium phytofermentans]